MSGKGPSAATFSPRKVHHLLLYVLQELGDELGAVELMKITFLIDAAYWRLFGQTLSGVCYTRGRYGPYSATVVSATREMGGHEITIRARPGRASRGAKVAHSLGPSLRFQPALLAADEEVVRQVLRFVRNLGPRELEDYAYSLEPMRAVVQQEIQGGGDKLIGQPLDFALLEPDAFMRQWLANREAGLEPPPDPEHERFAESEGSEFDQIAAVG